MARKKTHKVLVSVKFDAPCTAREAAAIFSDNVYGEFYPSPLARGGGPESMRVGRSVPKPTGRRALR